MRKRLQGLLIAMLTALCLLPTAALASTASSAVADPSTIWDWEDLIKDSTVNVGRIWTDKTVSTGNMTKDNITVEKAENGVFLTALTALSSTSNLSSTSTTPLDIVLVLDMSSSMTGSMGSTTKLAALKSAANAFVDTIAEQNESMAGEKNQHKVAVVSFNSTAVTQQGMTTCAGTAASDIKGVINGLQTSQYTRSDLALQNAQTVLTTSKEEGRKQIVVFFTDGTPTTSGSFDSGIASDAVTAANSMKAAGATVYTIGVLSGANPSVDPTGAGVTPENKFLHAVSSNYPSATYKNGTWTFGTRATTSDGKNAEFYKTATTADELAQIFADISKEITEGTGYPTATEEGYASTSGYITFNDQLGDYMQVTDLSKLVYDRVVYTSTGKSTYKTTNGSIDTYTFSGEVDSGAAKGNLNDLVITVTHSDDVATGDLVRMRIPASLIPLRHFNVDLTKPSMSVDETKPIALFYTTALKDGVADLLANPDATMAAYVAANTDATTGKVNFYANKWSGGTLGDATAVFSPSSANKYYYFTEDAPIYSDNGCTQRATSIESGKTYYYKHEYYRNVSEKPVLTYDTRSFPGDKAAAFAGSIGTDASGAYYFKKGTARLVYINELNKVKTPNTTGTAADVLNPRWNSETSVAAATTVTAHLGNNGKLSVEKPATLEVSKTVEVGEGYRLDDFTDTSFAFELSIPDAAGKTFNAQVLGADGKIAGDAFKLTFDAQGKAEHSIKHGEKLQVFGLSAGWAYTVSEKDADAFKQTSTGETGTFVAGQTAQASFTNTYEPDSVPYDAVVDLGVYKELTGREWTDSDEFTFKIEALTEGTPMPQKTSVAVTKADVVENGQAPVTFGDITYTKPGTYQYQVSEENAGQTIAGVKYTDNVAKFTVTVTDLDDNGAHTGELFAEAKLDSGELAFTNEYGTTDAEYDTAGFGLSKTLVGREWKDSDDFTFELAAVTEDAPMPGTGVPVQRLHVTKANAAAFGFGTITYKQPGTYEYQVKETAGEIGGIAYSTNVATYKVTVVDDGEGKLVATAELTSGSASFTNTYMTTDAEYDTAGFGLSKTLTGREWKDSDEFTFELAALTDGAPMPEKTSVAATKANAAAFDFGTITYKQPGTYEYKVAEAKGDLGGVTYSTNVATYKVTVVDDGEGKLVATAELVSGSTAFTNTYGTTDAEYDTAGFGLSKTLTGREWKDSDEFEFTLEAVTEGAPMPESSVVTVTKANAAAFGFGTITFKQPGTYEYKVAEAKGDLGGVTYSTNVATYKVTVVDDGEGKLVATAALTSGSASFTNTYTTTKTEYDTANAGFAKVLAGRDWADGDSFTFDLAAVTEGAPMPASTTATVTNADVVDGRAPFSFGTITYTAPGTYEYQVTEAKGSIPGVTYTNNVATLKVTVTDDGAGKLVAAATTANAVFTNAYGTTDVTYDTANFGLSKTLTGREWKDSDEFTFTLAALTDGAPMPAATTVAVTKDNAAAFGFGAITYTAPGTYEYQVTEVAGSLAGVTYSTNVATYKVTVVDNGRGNLVATSELVSGSANFTNKYFGSTDNPGGAAAQINATKTLTGRDMAVGEFFFGVRLAGETTDVLTATNAGDGTVALGKLHYDTDSLAELVAAGHATKRGDTWTVNYVAYEKTDGLVNKGVTAKTQPIAFTVTVVDNGDGGMTATANVPEGGLAFANAYGTGSAAIDVAGVKVLACADGLTPADITGKFTFTISSDDPAAPLPTSVTATNDKNGNVDFGAIAFTLDDLNRALGVTDEKKSDEVEKTNEDQVEGEKTTEAEKSVEDEKTKTDETKTDAAKTGASAEAEKTEGQGAEVKVVAETTVEPVVDIESEALTEEEPAEETKPVETVVAETEPEPEATVAESVAAEPEAETTAEPLVLLDAPIVSEVFGTTDAAATAEAPAAEGTLTAQPALFSRVASFFRPASSWFANFFAPRNAAQLKTAAETVPATEAAPAERSYTFVYTVTESGSVAGVTNDTAAKTVRVKVTDDGQGNLTAELLGEEGKPAFTFTNSYDATPVTTSVTDQIDVTKQLTGRDMEAGEFSFELLDGQDVVATGTNDASGSVTMDSVTYTKPGTYGYTLREVGAGTTEDGITYDATTYQVVTTVVDNGQGALVATHQVVGANDVVFSNTYEAKPTSVVIGAAKVLKGEDLKDGQFAFKLVGTDVELEATNKADGSVTFDAIEFTAPGTYEFDVYEVNDGQLNVTYDEAKHHVTVTVTDDGHGNLTAEVDGDEGDALTFTNTYTVPTPEPEPEPTPTPEPEPTPEPAPEPAPVEKTTVVEQKVVRKTVATPYTGDQVAWTAATLLATGALALLAIALRVRRTRK